MSRTSRPYRPAILAVGLGVAVAVFGMVSPASACLLNLTDVPVGSNRIPSRCRRMARTRSCRTRATHGFNESTSPPQPSRRRSTSPAIRYMSRSPPTGRRRTSPQWVGDAITVINTATNGTTQVTGIVAGSYPFGIATTPDGSQAIVTDYGDGHVLTVSTVTDAVTHDVNSGAGQLQGIALDPSGATAYVGSPGRVA